MRMLVAVEFCLWSVDSFFVGLTRVFVVILFCAVGGIWQLTFYRFQCREPILRKSRRCHRSVLQWSILLPSKVLTACLL